MFPALSLQTSAAGGHPLPPHYWDSYTAVAEKHPPSPWSSPVGSVDVGFVFRGRQFFFQGGEG